MAKTVLVIGGSYAGLAVTHKLLKNTLPTEKDVKVILVSKSSHLYWNMASVRGVIPNIVKDDELFQPIEPGLAQYPKENAEFVLGTATTIDAAAKTAMVTTSSGARSVSYDYLVIATGAGSSDASMPWKAEGSYEDTLSALHRTAESVKAASHIVVAGAGATGIELAAEIRYEFKDKTVVLLCADDALANGDSTAGALERELVKLGVEVRKGVRSEGAVKMADGSTQINLGGANKLVTDLYLPTMGLVPNSGFLPTEWLTEGKYVDVDEHMSVKAVKDTWAFGDVVSKPRASFLNTDAQSGGVAKNVELALKGKDQQVVKSMPIDVFVCSTGRGRGAGRLGYVPLPSLAVWGLKGRTLGMQRLGNYAKGNV